MLCVFYMIVSLTYLNPLQSTWKCSRRTSLWRFRTSFRGEFRVSHWRLEVLPASWFLSVLQCSLNASSRLCFRWTLNTCISKVILVLLLNVCIQSQKYITRWCRKRVLFFYSIVMNGFGVKWKRLWLKRQSFHFFNFAPSVDIFCDFT